MPSTIIGGGPGASGGVNLVSGAWFSGRTPWPVGGVQVRLSPISSGNVYVGLSGGVTIGSGNLSGVGSGLLDGMPLAPGDTYFVPKLGVGPSGMPQIYVACDAACSGQARVYWEGF